MCGLEPFFGNAGNEPMEGGQRHGGDGGPEEWAGRFSRRRPGGLSQGCLRFAFYGRVSPEE